MKIVIAQLSYTIGDFDNNKTKIIDAINMAKKENADLVVFAEHAVCGTPAYDLLNKADFLECCEKSLTEIASFCDNIAVLIGSPVLCGIKTFSAAVFIQDTRVVRYITKKNVILRDEQGFISEGNGYELIKLNGHKIAIVLGDDVYMRDEYSGLPETVINITSKPYARAIIEKRYDIIKGMSFSMSANVVFVNQVGANTDVIYDGSSSVFNSKGEPIALLKSFEEDFAVIDLAKDNPPVEIPYQDKTRNVYNAIKLGLREFFQKNGYKEACLGLSGGIDSAVVAAIAAEVLGTENIRVMLMPSSFSSSHSIDDALKMADNLGLRYDVVPINEAYQDILNAMRPVFRDRLEFGVTEENIQARIRCVMLMALSNKFCCKLLNTSNKSELAVGYGTLYGDNTGIISILGDLYKSEVYDLARYINRHKEIIPENILLKEPSGELRPGMKDTDTLPAYDVTDAIIYRMVEIGQSVEEITNAGFDAEVVQKIYEMIITNEQKRYQFCPVLRVSTRPFGMARRLPITSKYGF